MLYQEVFMTTRGGRGTHTIKVTAEEFEEIEKERELLQKLERLKCRGGLFAYIQRKILEYNWKPTRFYNIWIRYPYSMRPGVYILGPDEKP